MLYNITFSHPGHCVPPTYILTLVVGRQMDRWIKLSHSSVLQIMPQVYLKKCKIQLLI